MKIVALIPARFGATRFPGKLTADLCGKSVIARTYLSTLATEVFDQVIVVTDHDIIAQQIEKEGGKVFRSQKEHESGSDRIAEAISGIEADVVVNVQGDEPFQDKSSLAELVGAFEDPKVQVASMMRKITDETQLLDPNAVKVVVDQNNFSLYFSRSPIPYIREQKQSINFFRHIGVYAYRKQTLMEYTNWEKTMLEKAEMLEQLRLLENGIKIKMVETSHQAVAIDTEEDLDKAIAFYQNNLR
ncbi:3-deoxy-manno-octulosonate cytidylyltransferase [Echinicola jeungdonensis]|uniref:3-deoxy-manno-octulosonate cytidylyltransferase n=1 Tax=Echinicola jeungdonensis TaxID=709343 RepID=A0ABV5J418_9BACT|nr:3-deoxy-manno-octulosonate cytidylyltransferase [Echinicola jeungdonensis]MDN3670608.1 3-deoxy-manno-octulosonate cytidylyltransferase [Echinicola jeungdonensis]